MTDNKFNKEYKNEESTSLSGLIESSRTDRVSFVFWFSVLHFGLPFLELMQKNSWRETLVRCLNLTRGGSRFSLSFWTHPGQSQFWDNSLNRGSFKWKWAGTIRSWGTRLRRLLRCGCCSKSRPFGGKECPFRRRDEPTIRASHNGWVGTEGWPQGSSFHRYRPDTYTRELTPALSQRRSYRSAESCSTKTELNHRSGSRSSSASLPL